MNHFLARLGRSYVGQYGVIAAMGLGTCAYYGYQSFGHAHAEKFFGASEPDGTPLKISDKLRGMILEVFDECKKAGYHDAQDKLGFKNFRCPDPPIWWFASATIDPFIVGMGDYATGTSFAIPGSYNYEKPEDLPDHLFEIKKISFFRSLPFTGQQQKDEKERELDNEAMLVRNQGSDSLTVTISKIDKNSELGKQYIDSLVLSDDAKRYSLAQLLFISDEWGNIYKTLTLMAVGILAHSSAQTYVQYFKLKHAHVTQRIPGYFVCGLFGYGMYRFLWSMIDEYVETKAHKRTIELGDNYKAGSFEYYRKRAIRNEILGISSSRLFTPILEQQEEEKEQQH